MKKIDIPTLILILVTYNLCKQAIPQCQITLTTHKNCKSSIDIIKIFDKLKQKYAVSKRTETEKDEVTNQQKIDNKNAHINTSSDENMKNDNQINQHHTIPSTSNAKIRVNVNIVHQLYIENQVTYPYILLKVNDEENRYEGELSFVQIQYYLQLKCLKVVPPCASWMPPPIYPINIPPITQKQSYYSFLDFLLDNLPLKTCLNTSLPYPSTPNPYSPITQTITQLMHSLPLFPQFTHNIRSYLLNNKQRTLIIYFYNNKNVKQKQIKQKFVQLIQYIRVKDRRIGYHIKDQAREKLLFVCQKVEAGRGSGSGSGSGSGGIVQKLMGFVGLGDVIGKVVGIRFTGGRGKKVLESVLYNKQNQPVFDNKFIFWLQQISMTPPTTPYSPKLTNQNPKTCSNNKQNQLIYLTQSNNIKTTLKYLSLLNMLQQISQKQQNQKQQVNKQQEQKQKQKQEQEYGRLIFDVVSKIYEGFDIQESKGEGDDGILDELVQIRERRLVVSNRIQQILGNQAYLFYQWKVQMSGLQSVEVLYSQLPPIVLCLVGEQPIRFKDHLELLQYSLNNGLISLKNNQQIQKNTKTDLQQL